MTESTRPVPIAQTSALRLRLSQHLHSLEGGAADVGGFPGAVLMRACMPPIPQVTPIIFLENMKIFENS